MGNFFFIHRIELNIFKKDHASWYFIPFIGDALNICDQEQFLEYFFPRYVCLRFGN